MPPTHREGTLGTRGCKESLKDSVVEDHKMIADLLSRGLRGVTSAEAVSVGMATGAGQNV